MYKLIALFALIACAMASPKPGLLHAAAPAHVIATAPVATSYSNSYQKIHSAPILKTSTYLAAAPAYAAAPALAYSAHPAPLTYAAAAPVAYTAQVAAAPLAYNAPVAAW